MSAHAFAADLIAVVLAAAWKSSLLLLVGTLAVALARRQPAATRHRLWLATIIATLLVPIVHVTLERPATIERVMAKLSPASPPAPPPPPASVAIGRDWSSLAPVTAAPIAHSASGRGSRPGLWLAIWLGGAALAAAGLVRSLLRLRRLGRRASPADASWEAPLAEARRRLRLARPVQVKIVEGLGSPLIRGLGLRSHQVWVPHTARDWPLAMRRSVLLHELAHAVRGDVLASLIARVACVGYWFQPLAWIAWRRMAFERERACDDRVLENGVPPSLYAEHLLRASAPSFALAASMAAAPRPHLARRIRALLANDARSSSAHHSPLALASLAIGLGLGLAVLGPARGSASPLAPPAAAIDGHAVTPTTAAEFARPHGVLFAKAGGAGRVVGVRTVTLPIFGWCTDTGSLVVEGPVAFAEDFASIAAIGEGGYLLVERFTGASFERVEIARTDGVTHVLSWSDGQPVAEPPDRALAWLARSLPRALASTPIAIEQRVATWLRRGGAREALDRIAENPSSFVRAACLDALTRAAPLSADHARRALALARAITDTMVSKQKILERLTAAATRAPPDRADEPRPL